MLKYQKKVEHLLLILSKGEPDFEERKETEKYPDIWFFDIKAGQLYIYEYQKSQYCGLESSLEPFSQKFLQQKVTEERTELQRMLTPVNTILVFVNVVVFMILSFLGSTTDAEFMAAHGAMDWMDVVEKHQYYSHWMPLRENHRKTIIFTHIYWSRPDWRRNIYYIYARK